MLQDNEALISQMKQMRSELTSLSGDNDKLASALALAKSERKDMKSKLSSACNALQHTRDEWSGKERIWKEEKSELTKRAAQLTEQLSAHKGEFSSEVQNIRRELNGDREDHLRNSLSFEKQKNAYLARINQLECDLEHVQQCIAEKESQVSDITLQINAMNEIRQTEMSKTLLMLKNSRKECAALQESADAKSLELNNELETLKKTLKSLLMERSDSESHLNSVIAGLNDQVAKQDAKYQDFARKYENDMEAREIEIASQKKCTTDLDLKCESYRKDATMADDSSKLAHATIESLKAEILQLNDDSSKKLSEVNYHASKNADLIGIHQMRIAALEEERNMNASAFKHLEDSTELIKCEYQAKIEKLLTELGNSDSESASEVRKLNEELEITREKLSEIYEDHESLKKEFEVVSATSKQIILSLRSEIANTESKAKADILEFSAANAALLDNVTELNQSLLMLKGTVEIDQLKIESVTAQNKDLLSASAAEREEFIAKKKNLECELAEIQAHLESETLRIIQERAAFQLSRSELEDTSTSLKDQIRLIKDEKADMESTMKGRLESMEEEQKRLLSELASKSTQLNQTMDSFLGQKKELESNSMLDSKRYQSALSASYAGSVAVSRLLSDLLDSSEAEIHSNLLEFAEQSFQYTTLLCDQELLRDNSIVGLKLMEAYNISLQYSMALLIKDVHIQQNDMSQQEKASAVIEAVLLSSLNKNDTLESEITALRSMLESSLYELDLTKSELHTAYETAVVSNSSLSVAMREKGGLQRFIMKLTAQVDSAHDFIDSLEAQLDSSISNGADAMEKIEHLKCELLNSQSELAKVSTQSGSKIASLTDELLSVKAQLNSESDLSNQMLKEQADGLQQLQIEKKSQSLLICELEQKLETSRVGTLSLESKIRELEIEIDTNTDEHVKSQIELDGQIQCKIDELSDSQRLVAELQKDMILEEKEKTALSDRLEVSQNELDSEQKRSMALAVVVENNSAEIERLVCIQLEKANTIEMKNAEIEQYIADLTAANVRENDCKASLSDVLEKLTIAEGEMGVQKVELCKYQIEADAYRNEINRIEDALKHSQSSLRSTLEISKRAEDEAVKLRLESIEQLKLGISKDELIESMRTKVNNYSEEIKELRNNFKKEYLVQGSKLSALELKSATDSDVFEKAIQDLSLRFAEKAKDCKLANLAKQDAIGKISMIEIKCTNEVSKRDLQIKTLEAKIKEQARTLEKLELRHKRSLVASTNDSSDHKHLEAQLSAMKFSEDALKKQIIALKEECKLSQNRMFDLESKVDIWTSESDRFLFF